VDKHNRAVLEKLLSERRFDIRIFNDDGTLRDLSRKDREIVVDMLTDELCQTGLDGDQEPTPYGVAIDRLIDYFVPFDRPMHPTRGASG
jgi:hypothetical protein